MPINVLVMAALVMATMACSSEESATQRKEALASVFWVGEDATADNRHIPNHASAWDPDWIDSYGGVDDPTRRQNNGYWPEGFKPKENPFYVALPYWEYQQVDDRLEFKPNITRIPWYDPSNPPKINDPILKNRWVEVSSNSRTVYAQWEDVGPYQTDDVEYVFGLNPSKEQYGIDLSPATANYLLIAGSGKVTWRFVEEGKVPAGPWKEIVTTSRPEVV
jgi:hypothetical protein